MSIVSFSQIPSTFVCLIHSEPAKSTTIACDVYCSPFEIESRSTMSIAWDLEEMELRVVEAWALF